METSTSPPPSLTGEWGIWFAKPSRRWGFDLCLGALGKIELEVSRFQFFLSLKIYLPNTVRTVILYRMCFFPCNSCKTALKQSFLVRYLHCWQFSLCLHCPTGPQKRPFWPEMLWYLTNTQIIERKGQGKLEHMSCQTFTQKPVWSCNPIF